MDQATYNKALKNNKALKKRFPTWEKLVEAYIVHIITKMHESFDTFLLKYREGRLTEYDLKEMKHLLEEGNVKWREVDIMSIVDFAKISRA